LVYNEPSELLIEGLVDGEAMSGKSPWNDDADDSRDWSADEGFDDPVDADADDEPTIPCPGCGREIYAEADACPYCGEYLLYSDMPPHGQATWVTIGAMLALLAMISGFAIMAWALLVR
jgi:hypothetical protein